MTTWCSLGQSRVRRSLLVLLLTLTGCASSTLRTPPTRTPASTPSHIATSVPFPSALTGLLGPAPKSCPSGPSLDELTIDDTFGDGFVGGDVFYGRSHVWNDVLYAGQSLPLESFQGMVTPSPYLSTKVMWIVGPNYHQPVTLSGHELSTGAPVWFDLSAVGNSPGNPVTTAVLDPNHPNRGDTGNASGTWNTWGILIYFFSAGCYQINVVWPGISWQAVFMVGR